METVQWILSILWLNKSNNLLTSFRFRHRQMCKLILQLSIRVMCNSTAITCTCVPDTHAHACGYGLQKSVCVSADINHFSTAAVCRSIYPQISRLKSPSNHHVASQRSPPGRLSNLSRLCVWVCVCDSMCLPLCLRECASVQNAWEQMCVWENVLVWVSVWLCVIMSVTSTF